MKFNENRLKGSGEMERTRKSRVNPLTCDLESRWLGHVLCTLSYQDENE